MGRAGVCGPEVGHRMQVHDKDVMQNRRHMINEAVV